MDAIFHFPVEKPMRDVDVSQETLEVAPVLTLQPFSTHFSRGQQAEPLPEVIEIHKLAEWDTINEKEPDLFQRKCFLSQKHKPTYCESQGSPGHV